MNMREEVFIFRKVSLMEDTDQNIHLKNLSVHQASNEEDALNLLFLGDTNRMIAEVWARAEEIKKNKYWQSSREEGVFGDN